MCGRASLSVDPEELREIFDLNETPELPPRYNIAPSQPIAVIRTPHHLELLRWGAPHGSGLGINVRVESVARAPGYRDSFWHRRCLVVVSSFYEWKKTEKAKQPYVVCREDRKPFALGGIWAHMATSDGEVIDVCSILTGPPKGVVAELHDRMPLVISHERYAMWLAQESRKADLMPALATDANGLIAYPVSSFVNSASNDGPECIEPMKT